MAKTRKRRKQDPRQLHLPLRWFTRATKAAPELTTPGGVRVYY